MADSIIGKISVGDGATFTPKIENDVLSWTNDKNLPNPDSLDIVGATFTPDVDEDGVLSWTNNKGLPNPDSVDIAQAVVDKKPGWGLPVGYEYFSINPNVPQGSLPLLGGEYNRSTYSDLWEWVQQQTGYLKTESEWQALSTAHNGNVPYYSDGDGSTTFRVPSLQCWVRGANGSVSTVGSYLAAGLPNITGTIRPLSWGNNSALSGAFSEDSKYIDRGTSTGTQIGTQTINFNASSSNSIYGNSSTVQPESIVGLWLVKAYGTIVDTGTIDEQQYIDDRIAALPNTFLPRTGGTMTGNIIFGNNEAYIQKQNPDIVNRNQLEIGWGRPETTGGGEWFLDGAKMAFHSYNANNSSYDNGGFVISTTDGTNHPQFTGYPDGRLVWDNKEIERVNSSGSNYIRYESGLQICWTVMSISMSGASTTGWTGTYYTYRKIGSSWTYPVSFVSMPTVVANATDSGNYWSANVSIASTTNAIIFLMGNNNTDTKQVFVFAIGKWK